MGEADSGVPAPASAPPPLTIDVTWAVVAERRRVEVLMFEKEEVVLTANEVLVEFAKCALVLLPKNEGTCAARPVSGTAGEVEGGRHGAGGKSIHEEGEEELKMPVERIGKAEEPLKGEDVSVSGDADQEEDQDGSGWAEAVVDGAPSPRVGIKPGRDTLGNVVPKAEKPAVSPARESDEEGATVSERRVETPVTAPEAST